MRPAWSVIFFTAIAGTGYGLLGWLSVALILGQFDARPALIAVITGAALVSAGLLSSTFHLGHPERAWRAVSQWRSSWLSREGVVALLTFVPIVWLGWSVWQNGSGVVAAAVLLLLGSVATIYCTAMIYASLKTIAAWHHPLVPLVYLVLATATGGYLLLLIDSLFGQRQLWLVQAVAGAVIVAWLLKLVYWKALNSSGGNISSASATGLTGQVTALDPPHTGANYLLHEMVYQVGRRHAGKLRSYALLLGLAAPLGALFEFNLPPVGAAALIGAGFAALLTATFIERWLFFAQARHVVSLYYGAARA